MQTEYPPYVIEKVFDAPARNVWRALTEIGFIRQWYFNIPVFRAKVGFEFSFEGSGDCTQGKVHVCKVTEVVVGKKLSYSWRYEGYEGDSLVTFEIFEEGTKRTKLRLTHAGLETFPFNRVPGMERKDFAGGWTYYIDTALRELLARIPQ